MECPPAGGLFGDGGGAFVGQSSSAGVWAFVSSCGDEVGAPVGEENGFSASPGRISGEKTRRARGPEHVFSVAAFTCDHRSLSGKVQILHVEREDFPGPSGGFVQHPPQGFFSQVYVSS